MQKFIEIEQHLLFFIDFLCVPKYRVRSIRKTAFERITEQNKNGSTCITIPFKISLNTLINYNIIKEINN